MDPDRVSVVFDIKRRLRKEHSEDIFKQFITLGGYGAFAAVATGALHVIMARALGPESYAAYGTYVAILFTVLFSLASIHLIITRFISYHRSRYQYEQINYIITHALRFAFIAGLVVFLAVMLGAQSISAFFQLESIAPTVVLGFVLWFSLLVPVFEGAFKGLEDFSTLGRFRVRESALRFFVATMLVILGFNVAGALFGLGLGTFIALAVTYRHLYHVHQLKMVRPNMQEIRRFAVPVALSMVALALLLNVDIILVKHYYPATEAGMYAATSFLAKIPFLVSMVFVGVMFPKVTQLHADGKRTVQVLKSALQVLVPLVAVFTIASLFLAEPLFLLLFGEAYQASAGLVLYVFGMGMLAIALLLVVYLLAIRRDTVAFMLPVFLVGYMLLLVIFHTTFFQLFIVSVLVMTVILCYALWIVRDELDFDRFF